MHNDVTAAGVNVLREFTSISNAISFSFVSTENMGAHHVLSTLYIPIPAKDKRNKGNKLYLKKPCLRNTNSIIREALRQNHNIKNGT